LDADNRLMVEAVLENPGGQQRAGCTCIEAENQQMRP
jgi:hypothetical protein